MSLPDKAFPVSWDQFHRDARALAWRLSGSGQTWSAIVCITRGGLVPAAIISRELDIRRAPFNARASEALVYADTRRKYRLFGPRIGWRKAVLLVEGAAADVSHAKHSAGQKI